MEFDWEIPQLAGYRSQIDEFDRHLVGLLNKRTPIIQEVARVKQECGWPIYDPQREQQMPARLAAMNPGPVPNEAAARVFVGILAEMRALEQREQEHGQ